MENLSRTFSRKTYGSSNGYAASASAAAAGGKSVYDDVFGGPPKFSVPTLSPRAEDYTEIFGGFHTSRGFSIPILELPFVDHEANDVSFDVRSPKFDYFEVFSGSHGLDIAVSYEELFGQPNDADDSSEEAWTPALSDSPSDESDPSAFSETNQVFSDGDTDYLYDGDKEFHISYHKANQRRKEDMSNETTHVTQLHTVPGYSFVVDQNIRSRVVEDDNPPLHATCDLNLNESSNGKIMEGQQFRKTMSLPPRSSSAKQAYPRDPKLLGGYGRSSSCVNEAFITVSDISLQTQPSQLPPPSRPPPPLGFLDGNSGGTKSTIKASKSYSSEVMAGSSSPPFFDVEIDANSSAAVSAANMKDVMERAMAKLKGAKESMEKKREGVQTHTKLRLGNNSKVFEGKLSGVLDGSECFDDETVQGTRERERGVMKPFTRKERQKVMKNAYTVSGSMEDESQFHVTKGTVACKEETEFYEVMVELDESKRVCDQMRNEKILYQTVMSNECGWEKQRATKSFGLQEDNKVSVASATCQHQPERGMDPGGQNSFMDSSKAANKSRHPREYKEKVEVSEVCELKDNVKTRAGPLPEEIKGLPDGAVIWEERENFMGNEQKGDQAKLCHENTETKKSLKDVDERKETQGQPKVTVEEKENGRRGKISAEQAEKENTLKEASDLEEKSKQQMEACNREEDEKTQREAQEKEESKYRPKADFKQEEEMNRLEGSLEQETITNLKKEVNCNLQKLACKGAENEKRLQQVGKQEASEHRANPAIEQEEYGKKQEEASDAEEMEKKPTALLKEVEKEWRHKEVHEEESNNRLQNVCEIEESENFREEGVENKSKEAWEWEETMRFKTAVSCEGLEGHNYCCEQTDREDNLNLGHEIYLHKSEYSCDVSEGLCKLDENEIPRVCRLAAEHDMDNGKMEAVDGPSCDHDTNLQAKEVCNSSSSDEDDLQHKEREARVQSEIGADTEIAQTNTGCDKKAWKMASTQTNANSLPHGLGDAVNEVQWVYFSFDHEGSKVTSSEGEGKANTQSSVQKLTNQKNERKEKSLTYTVKPEEREEEERLKREKELENDRLRKIEEEREREREREKDHMAVDRATLEVRERAFAETREKAERAAVQRATAEVPQRAMAEARERRGKASAEVSNRSFAEKASIEARHRAERAAVERATAEARERAVEKAMSDKAAFEARERVERSVAEKVSASSRSDGMKESLSSSDLQDLQLQSGLSSKGLRYSYSFVHDGFEGESAQRCKARLERHRRTAERAAKALAEKNMRDLLAQREQAERNRLAEALDVEVKRWSSNKEGNLRALLSTLQYILGPDSGWQPIPLTEVITSVAVKKAYRKATLCVHPDKLQQRGASIQQKYICEKVFDLLKEAWNKFNSEER